MEKNEEFNFQDRDSAEAQLLAVQKTINFSLSELPVEVLVEKLPKGASDTDSDFTIPEYQREFTWEDSRQAKFIESILMGLPIPFLFGYVDENLDDRTVIVDGVQRLNTLKAFMEDRLTLKGLARLDALNDFRFKDLSALQQRRFRRRTLRMIVLDNADKKTQFELFERINTGSKRPSPAEIRRGAFPGPYRDVVVKMADSNRFKKLTPMGQKPVKQRQREELVARLFAYSDRLADFRHDVTFFINDHFESMNEECRLQPGLAAQIEKEFENFCEVAEEVLPSSGFGSGGMQTPRNRFEALGVGLLLALREGADVTGTHGWIESDSAFHELVKSGGSNSARRLNARVGYAKDKFAQEKTDDG